MMHPGYLLYCQILWVLKGATDQTLVDERPFIFPSFNHPVPATKVLLWSLEEHYIQTEDSYVEVGVARDRP